MRRLPRAETVLPFLIVLGAVVLGASEFMTAFEFTPPGGEVQMEQTVADRHAYAMLVLAAFAVVALVGAIVTASRPAAFAVAALGGLALLLFLILDLPDAGKIGPLEDFITARAEPQIGFWLEALGAVAVGLGGAAFATLTPEQLETTRDRFRGGDRERRRNGDPAAAESSVASAATATATATATAEGDTETPARRTERPASGRRTAVPFDQSRDTDGEPPKRGRRGRFRATSRRPRPR